MVYFESFWTDLAIAISGLVIAVVIYTKYTFSYWKRNGIVEIQPSFPFGNVKDIVLKTKSSGFLFKEWYDELKRQKVPVGGYYFMYRPELLLVDPDVIKCVMQKDFQHFTDRGLFVDEKNDPLSGHLFSLGGVKWKNMRAKLTPTFTSGKMKMMFYTVVACSDELNNILQDKSMKAEPMDIKDILARFTTDVIGSVAFGIDCNCLKTPNTEFRKYGVAVFEPKRTDQYRSLASFLIPNIMRFFKIPAINRDVTKFFLNVVSETVKYREDNNISRKDFMHLLLQLKNKGKVIDDEASEAKIKGSGSIQGLTLEEIAAQCFVFFLAGFETSSTTMTFCLYELVQNPDIQEKVREEIITVLNKYNGEITYEAIMDMHYMDKVINEALRKYPPLPFLNRKCNQDYKLPKTNYTVRKGEMLRISVLGLQRDPEHYPDPEKFDPERFTEEEKAKRHPFTFIPFGEGPRICIGLRFGFMQSKVGLAVLLRSYRFTLNAKTKTPLVMDPKSTFMSTQGGIWLDAHKVVS